mgnify:CR=1 FL=1
MKSQKQINRVIDFHVHIDSREHLDEVRQIEDEMNVTKAILVSGNMIAPGKLGDFLRGQEPLVSSDPNNEFLAEIIKSDDRFGAFFTIDPEYHMEEDIEDAIEAGFSGVKFNTIVHKIDFTSKDVESLVEIIDDAHLPVYTHITLNPKSNLEALLGLARKYRNANFIIGHMGFSTSDFAAITAAETLENVYLESSIGSRLAFEEMRRRGLSKKLIFGSEFPTHDPRIELSKLEYIFDEEELENIVYQNAMNLLNRKK